MLLLLPEAGQLRKASLLGSAGGEAPVALWSLVVYRDSVSGRHSGRLSASNDTWYSVTSFS